MNRNGFARACEIERLGELDLLPYMDVHWPGCIYYPTEHHVLVQKVCGDVLAKYKGQGRYIEFKTEETNDYGNFYIETWSNKARQTVGWYHYCMADWMWYYFLRDRALYMWRMNELREWGRTNLSRFPEKPQGKHAQKNDTWGRCVPINVLATSLPSFQGPQDPVAAVGTSHPMAWEG